MSKGRLLAIIAALGIIVAVASISLGQAVSVGGGESAPPAETPDAAEVQGIEPVADGDVGVGVFDAEAIWKGWEGRAEAEANLQAIQMEAQQAQQAGDQATLMASIQKMEEAQQQLMDGFMTAIQEAASAVAGEAGLQVVVNEIVHEDGSIGERDITQQLLARMNESPSESDESDE